VRAGILVTYRKAFRKYTNCWEDHTAGKLKSAEVVSFKYRKDQIFESTVLKKNVTV